jgi:hypothetical protein
VWQGEARRGQVPLIYLHVQELDQFHLVTVYAKDQKDDVSADAKKAFRRFVQILKDQARRAMRE